MGFTILEMLLALSVFLLLCGAIFGILLTTIRTSTRLHDDQSQQETILALNSFLQSRLGNLSANTRILTIRSEDEDEDSAGGGLLIGDGVVFTALEAQADSNGHQALRIAGINRSEVSSMDTTDSLRTWTNPRRFLQAIDSTLSWRILIHDLISFSCQYRGGDAKSPWVSHWQDADRRPRLVKLIFIFPGREIPTSMIFWIPPIAPPLVTFSQ